MLKPTVFVGYWALKIQEIQVSGTDYRTLFPSIVKSIPNFENLTGSTGLCNTFGSMNDGAKRFSGLYRLLFGYLSAITNVRKNSCSERAAVLFLSRAKSIVITAVLFPTRFRTGNGHAVAVPPVCCLNAFSSAGQLRYQKKARTCMPATCSGLMARPARPS